ncbi:hypothetical protein E0504_31320 [Parafrankia sp. BMG5.11]|nr:hypothetical protein E0504_31320 [Parafrankia sp. BMG5.11]
MLITGAVSMTASCSSSSDDAAPAPRPVWTNLGHPLDIDAGPLVGPSCEPAAPDGPLIVTGSCVDPELTRPYVDVDERRKATDPATDVTVSFRYVHGGFRDTKAKFAFYFPDRYEGRFFEYTYPTLGTEDALPGTIAFAVTNGAYAVATNNAGGLPGAGELGGYRVNAASAKFSRVVAAQVYGDSARPRGYIYGASGGAYQTMGALEKTEGVWDGGVPMVPGTGNSIPSSMTVELLGLRVLHDKFPQIVDAMEPGGSGDPYAGLNKEQQAVLREATRLGFPLRGWWNYANLDGGAFSAVGGGVRILDASYVDDFWTRPGYAGTDPASSAGTARVRFEADVTALTGDPGSGLRLSAAPTGDLTGADIVVVSGAAAGKTVPLGGSDGDTVTFGDNADSAVTGAIRPGDRVRIDNSWFLALQYYQRYQVPSRDLYGWNQFRDANGAPLYPQRTVLAGPTFTQAVSGGVPTGKFHGKMIMLASLMDVEAFPWPADWYARQAKATLGSKLNDNYRVWFMDNAGHTQPLNPAAETHLVSYDGELQQALLHLDEWVANGTAPPASTAYTVDGDTQVHPAATAAERRGVQPTVTLAVSRVGTRDVRPAARADAAAGQPVTLSVQAETPPDTGKIIKVEWDFDGTGRYPEHSELDKIDRAARLTIAHTFTRPGTYFPVVRVTSERNGDPKAPFGLVQNLARVRVVVR